MSDNDLGRFGARLFDLEPDVAIEPETEYVVGSNSRGALSELKAMTRLIELGHKIAIPLVDDDGVDFVVDYRTTVQVKARRSANRATYAFTLPASRGRTRADGSWYQRPVRTFADVFIFHGQDHDVWWVASRQLLAEYGIDRESTAVSLSFTGAGCRYSALSALALENWATFG